MPNSAERPTASPIVFRNSAAPGPCRRSCGRGATCATLLPPQCPTHARTASSIERDPMELIQEASAFFLLAFPALFSILNPLGGAFIFLAATRRLDPPTRALLARWV